MMKVCTLLDHVCSVGNVLECLYNNTACLILCIFISCDTSCDLISCNTSCPFYVYFSILINGLLLTQNRHVFPHSVMFNLIYDFFNLLGTCNIAHKAHSPCAEKKVFEMFKNKKKKTNKKKYTSGLVDSYLPVFVGDLPLTHAVKKKMCLTQ